MKVTVLQTAEDCIAERRSRGVTAADDVRGSLRAWRLYEKLSPRAYPGGRFEAGLARLAAWERDRQP